MKQEQVQRRVTTIALTDEELAAMSGAYSEIPNPPDRRHG
jgi:hypothetical protein